MCPDHFLALPIGMRREVSRAYDRVKLTRTVYFRVRDTPGVTQREKRVASDLFQQATEEHRRTIIALVAVLEEDAALKQIEQELDGGS